MGREVRRVPANWVHPKNWQGHDIPLLDGFTDESVRWKRGSDLWEVGLVELGEQTMPRPTDIASFAEWDTDRPDAGDYMPEWPAAERTHYQMYETTTEGTPISPVMASPEELARWLADNGASAFGSTGASYEGWLRVCQGAWAPSAVMIGGRIIPGVDAAIGGPR